MGFIKGICIKGRRGWGGSICMYAPCDVETTGLQASEINLLRGPRRSDRSRKRSWGGFLPLTRIVLGQVFGSFGQVSESVRREILVSTE